jgi:type IV secretion system protein VirB5
MRSTAIRKAIFALPMLAIAGLGLPRSACAQFAVIDVASIVQEIQEVQSLAQQVETAQKQLSTAVDHLAQARQQYAALTGDRGMEQLLPGQQRNYLPTSWGDIAAALQGASGAPGSFSAAAQALITANAVLSAQDLSGLSPPELAHLNAARQNAALLQVLSRQAITTTSERFATLQQLIGAIQTAQDPKAALDLQARIAAEQAMLQNDCMKLQALYQAAEAEDRALRQREGEQAIADIGSLRALPPMGLAQR